MININVFVRNEEQLKIVKDYPVNYIYTDNYNLIIENPSFYYQIPRNFEEEYLPKNILVGEVGTIWKYQNKKNMVSDFFLNVVNHHAIELLMDYGVERIILSIESTKSNIEEILSIKKYPIEVIIYGVIEDMLLKSHPLMKENGFSLKDSQGNLYPVVVDRKSHVHIFHSKPINYIEDICSYIDIGVTNFRVDFFHETEEEIRKVLSSIFEFVKN